MKIKCIKSDNTGGRLILGQIYEGISAQYDTYYIQDSLQNHYWYKTRFEIVEEKEEVADGFDAP